MQQHSTHAHAQRLGGLLLVCMLQRLAADFAYIDFNSTAGLTFNGVATTSSCADGHAYSYSVAHGTNDATGGELGTGYHLETTSTIVDESFDTHTAPQLRTATRYEAAFPHRTDALTSPTSPCPVRLRLTPARLNRAGSVLRLQPAPVLNGFETGFSFQISDASLACTQVKDRAFSINNYRTCTVNGGDGFAFILHGESSAALGESAAGLGYNGLSNTLAIEFDTWYNPEGDYQDLPSDHLSVQASSASSPVSSLGSSRISAVKRVPIADGRVHTVRIVYYRYVRLDLAQYFAISESLSMFLSDAGESRRLGTLVVYYDDMATPLIALPLNLNGVLRLPQNQAFLGFTAATGRKWQKHDILDWYFCEQPGCPEATGNVQNLRYRPE